METQENIEREVRLAEEQYWQAIKDNDLGYSIGFGVDGFATDHFGIRADYRYFRTVNADESSNIVGISLNEGNFSFSRGSIGAVFRF